MDDTRAINPEDLLGLTDQEIIKLLDSGWPWPLDAVQTWFEQLWNNIQKWFYDVVVWIWDKLVEMKDTIVGWFLVIKDWIAEKVTPIVDRTLGWIKTEVGKVWGWITTEVGKVWDWIVKAVAPVKQWIIEEVIKVFGWIKTEVGNLWSKLQPELATLAVSIAGIASTVANKVGAINQWFSNEFIDPFLDWLLQFPGKFIQPFEAMLRRIGTSIESWFTHKSPGFLNVLAGWYKSFNEWWSNNLGFGIPSSPVYIGEKNSILVLLGAGLLNIFVSFASIFADVIDVIGPVIGRAVLAIFSRMGGWLGVRGATLGAWIAARLPSVTAWFGKQWFPILSSSLVIGLGATGTLQDLIAKFIAPPITGIMDWAEKMGPVSPELGTSPTRSVANLMTFTVSGLASMTLMGETLSPLKHLGMGHISAMLYDLINYRTLTAAFMGTLAFVYIRTPLTYYYNKMARPNIPNERGLSQLASDYEITEGEFGEGMAYQGYDDKWIKKLYDIAFRPLTPRLLGQLATAGGFPEDIIDRELHHAGYRAETIPYIKQMMVRMAEGELKTLMTSLPITRFKEGFDSEAELTQNLAALGVDSSVMPKYIFAARLSYLYDYQTDLKAYYIDSYHRRDIEEPELRSNLASIGVTADRLDLIVSQQSIKRLAAPKAAEDPAIAVQFDTIRDRRKKLLITREQEIEQMIAIGKEISYATAIADNDDVALAEKAAIAPPVPKLTYETEEGKIEVDTIRRLRRQRQTSEADEFNGLIALEMPESMAQAVVDNDSLRLTKQTTE